MEREIRPGMKKQIKSLRKKYCEGLCSDFYIKTGIPRIHAERVEQAKEDLKPMLKENEKKTKEAIKTAKKRRGRKTKKEEQLIYV